MKVIFSRNDYRILVDAEERKACIVKGNSSISVPLEPLTPLSTLAARHLRMIGCDPAKYLNIGHTNQVLIKDAAQEWQQALGSAERRARDRDTSMIMLFWESLPGLPELREAEDSYAAGAHSASLLLEHRPLAGPPAQLAALRAKFPRAAAYVLAEQFAFSADDKVAEKGRQALALLAGNKSLEEALALLPMRLPGGNYQSLRRNRQE